MGIIYHGAQTKGQVHLYVPAIGDTTTYLTTRMHTYIHTCMHIKTCMHTLIIYWSSKVATPCCVISPGLLSHAVEYAGQPLNVVERLQARTIGLLTQTMLFSTAKMP
jgi:hypothetical protein